jgi:hypothetical protein
MENKNKAGDAQTVLFKRLHGVSPDTFKKCCRFFKGNTLFCIKKAVNRPN